MLEQLRALQRLLQGRKIAEYRRRVPVGDLLTDRWENAREMGFGEGTSVYDSALILGDVKVGRHTWIGPNVVLDGLEAPLMIGDYCSISAGVQVYTHDTVKWSVSLGRAAKMEAARTTIGDGVYIGPNSIVSKGVHIGSRSIVGAMSFVNSDVPARSKAWGCPARVVGTVPDDLLSDGQ
jgi:acetyltransferase-like isoleucine patch superfamily enzyme